MVARLTNLHWDIGRRSLDLGDSPHVMGILNVTPDSFSDGGQHFVVKLGQEELFLY